MSKEDQNYEAGDYWSFTAAKTKIQSVSDNLKIIIDAIDKKKDYSAIQDEVINFNKFKKDTSARKRYKWKVSSSIACNCVATSLSIYF